MCETLCNTFKENFKLQVFRKQSTLENIDNLKHCIHFKALLVSSIQRLIRIKYTVFKQIPK